MKKSMHGGKRKGSGRVQQFGKARPVRLTAAQIRIAKQLGDGNVSAGIRVALEIAARINLDQTGK